MAWGPTTSSWLPGTVNDGASHPVEHRWTTRLIHWIVDARSHRIICLVLGIWLINAFDLVFTILSHEQGMLDEQNPLARRVLLNGTLSVALFKIGMVLIGSYPLLRFRKARVTELAAYLILIAYVLLAFRWSICYELFTLANVHDVSLADLETTLGAPLR